jgi:membrane-anchored mycosin MYCP
VDVAAPGEDIVSLNPGGTGLVDALPTLGHQMPISGTSYATPVVSGLAALIRARFPEFTARQVMQRIEGTAQPPPGGWNGSVGNGVIDPAAALRSDVAPTTSTPEPAPPAATNSPRRRARTTAMIGTAVCAAVLTLAMIVLSSTARLRRSAAVGRRAESKGLAGRLDRNR